MLPDIKGCYGLGFFLPERRIISIGALGERSLLEGRYIYFGSAMGPGGLRARIRHHFFPKERPHWHIDYLLNNNSPDFVWYITGPELLECRWSQTAGMIEKVEFPIMGFGASDCKAGCTAHLIKVPDEHTNKMIGDILVSVSGITVLSCFGMDRLSESLI